MYEEQSRAVKLRSRIILIQMIQLKNRDNSNLNNN